MQWGAEQVVVEGNSLIPDARGGKFRFDQATAGSAKTPAQIRIVHQLIDSSRQRPCIIGRHQECVIVLPSDFAAAGHIRCNYWPAARRRFEEALRQSLTTRWKHCDVRASPHLADIIDVPEYFDVRPARPCRDLLRRNRNR